MADKDEIKVVATAKTVENDKTRKKEDELKAFDERKKEADLKAKENLALKEAEEKKKAEEKRKLEEEKAKAEAEAKKKNAADVEKVVAGAATIAGAVLAGKKKKGFFSGLIIGVIVGFLLATMLGLSMRKSITDKIDTVKDNVDEVLDSTFLGYTVADFKDVILGEASQHQELIVMEQPLEIMTTVTKAGLGNLQIFSKVKNVTYAGTGVYTVDLSKIDSEYIDVDEITHTIIVKVPHATLQYVNLDYDEMSFEDTEKGLLAFGDISLTLEQQNELESSVQKAMRERLESVDLFTKADGFAKMMTWDIFQPLVSAVSPEFKVEIVFVD